MLASLPFFVPYSVDAIALAYNNNASADTLLQILLTPTAYSQPILVHTTTVHHTERAAIAPILTNTVPAGHITAAEVL